MAPNHIESDTNGSHSTQCCDRQRQVLHAKAQPLVPRRPTHTMGSHSRDFTFWTTKMAVKKKRNTGCSCLDKTVPMRGVGYVGW